MTRNFRALPTTSIVRRLANLFHVMLLSITRNVEGDNSRYALTEQEAVPRNTSDLYRRTIDSVGSVVSQECGLWVAPSAIPGAGLGMYAGRDFKENDLLQDVGDLCIPIIDIVQHQIDDNFKFVMDDYTWNTAGIEAGTEGFHQVTIFTPGLGALPNSLPILNIDVNAYPPYRDYVGLHRATDPGAGAFTPYYNRGCSAMRNIQAGEELYLSYGPYWFGKRADLGPVPVAKDIDMTTKLFHEFYQMKKQLVNLTEHPFQELLDTFIINSQFNNSVVFGIFNSLQPSEMVQLTSGKSMSQVMIQKSTRTKEWLEQHGTCGDHLRAGPSTLTQAGHGAFANRDLPSGTVVARLPLILLTNRSWLNMYSFPKEQPRTPSLDEGERQPQLLLNYCHGHNESTILLCPYGPMVLYINHNQTQANARVKWADPFDGNLLDASVEELERIPKAKLAFDLVATRDISEGEEVFMDYGNEWEQAWQRHVNTWRPVEGAGEFESVDALNEKLENEQFPLYSEFDYLENPQLPRIPPNVEFTCDDYFGDNSRKLNYTIDPLTFETSLHQSKFFQCRILRTKQTLQAGLGKLMYTVDVHRDDNDQVEIWEDCPHVMFQFRLKPYTSDIFLRNAFRHDIRVPDELFPHAWRNLSPNYQK